MTISASNSLGGQKTGDGGFTDKNGNKYGGFTHNFAGEDATKRAKFQFDFERPSHCLLENNVADVIDGKEDTNCTVFPISLDEDIRTVTTRMCYFTQHTIAYIANVCEFATLLGIIRLVYCICFVIGWYISSIKTDAIRYIFDLLSD